MEMAYIFFLTNMPHFLFHNDGPKGYGVASSNESYRPIFYNLVT